MALKWCDECNKQIDLDVDAEHNHMNYKEFLCRFSDYLINNEEVLLMNPDYLVLAELASDAYPNYEATYGDLEDAVSVAKSDHYIKRVLHSYTDR